MIWIGVLSALVVGFLVLNRWANKPMVYRRRLDAAADIIDSLNLATKGSVVTFEHEGSERFLQLAQRSEVLGVSELVFGFPDAPWSREYFDHVRQRLEWNGTDFEIAQTGDPTTRRFIQVLIEGNDDSVTRRAIEVLSAAAKAIGLDEDTELRCVLNGHPDHAKWAWRNRGKLEGLRARGGIGGRTAAWSLRAMNGRMVDPEAEP